MRTELKGSITDIKEYYEMELGSVTWKPNGQGTALCPFHDDKNESLSVNSETGQFYCHGCNAKGSVENFKTKRYSMRKDDAVQGLLVKAKSQAKRRIIETYDYEDESGKRLYQAVRYEPKDFRQRRRVNGEWVYNLEGVKRVLYNLPEVIEAGKVYLVEGEKDVESLRNIGLVATCNPMGAGKWKAEYNSYFTGKEVIILPDNDKVGRDHAESVAQNLKSTAQSIKVIELPDLEENGDVTDWIENDGSKRELMKIVSKTPEWVDERVTDVTDVTVDDNDKIIRVSQFPLEIFPERFQRFVTEVSRALNVDPGLIASVAMAILSGAIGNTIKVVAKPGYEVSLFIWFIVVARSGEGKTPAMSTLMRHVEKLQSEAMQEYVRQYTEYKNDDTGNVQKPTPKHYLVSNHTVEALSDIYENSGRGVTMHVDEVSRLILSFNQYKRKGNDRQHYIELFNGGSWKIDRKAGHIFIPNTGAAIIGGIQPGRLPKIFGDESFDDGLLPRFLLYLNSNHTVRFNPTGISDEQIAYWEHLVGQCYDIPLNHYNDGFVKPRLLRMESEALEEWIPYHNDMGKGIPYLSEHLRAFMIKLIAYYSLKFTGMLHIIQKLHEAEPLRLRHPIERRTVQQAITLTKFFSGQAAKALELYQQKNEFNEYEKQLVRTLFHLKDEAGRGKLLSSRITETLNNRLPDGHKLSPEKIASMIRRLGLKTEKGGHNLAYLIWEPAKIEKLFSDVTVTTITTVTQDTPTDVVKESNHATIPVRKTIRLRIVQKNNR
jgi:5S rRNA maturation endonuclease (ribonuclease M5)